MQVAQMADVEFHLELLAAIEKVVERGGLLGEVILAETIPEICIVRLAINASLE